MQQNISMKSSSLEGGSLKLRTQLSMAPTVSIMESKRVISDIEMEINAYGQGEEGTTVGMRNRQISSGVIIDWKQFQVNQQVKSQLLLKDGQNDEKTIFSYVVEEWCKDQPVQVIYRWIRKPPRVQNKSHTAHLVQEEHVYRGPMRHYRKNGSGLYIIIQKYSDNTERIKSIKGEWVQDILKKGVMTDENGGQQTLSSNVLKLSMRSRKQITPYLEKNQAIEEIKKKSMHIIPSAKKLPSLSAQSIQERTKIS